MSNPAPTLNQINAFNATQGTTIDFNIIGGTEVIRSNKIYIYDLSDNSLICTHLYVSTESIHELPPNTSSSIVYASGKSSADFTNNTQYYAQIQTFTDVGGTQGGSGLSIAKLFWCLPTPTLTLSTIPTTISTTSYNVSATYTPNTSGGATNEIQEFQFNLYSAIGALLQTSGVVLYGEGVDLSYNFSGLEVDSTYYVTLDVTTTQGMNVSAQSNTFTVSIDTPTMGSASVVNNGCDGYISVTSNLSSEYEHEESAEAGEIMSFTTDSVNDITELDVDFEPVQDGTPWMSAQDTTPYMFRPVPTQTEDFGHESDCIVGGTVAWNQQQKNTVSRTSNGITYTYLNGKLTISGTATASSWWLGGGDGTAYDWYKDHIYFVDLGNDSYVRAANAPFWYVPSGPLNIDYSLPKGKSFFKATRSAQSWLQFMVPNGYAISEPLIFYPQVFDLTQMFGTTIADYVYTLEQGTAGAGVAWLRANEPQLFEYHAYDSGSLVSVSNLTAHVTRGKNLADLDNVTRSVGASITVDKSKGEVAYTTSVGFGANGIAFMKELPAGTYTINYTNTNNDSSTTSNYSFVLPFVPTGATGWSGDNYFCKSLLQTEEGHYKNISALKPYTFVAPKSFVFGLVCSYNTGVTGKFSSVQLEMGDTGTAYEPPVEHSYPLDSTLTLRGIPKLDNGKLYYDGDRYNADGSVDRRYGIVDLGSLTYTIVSGAFAATISDKANGIGNLLCVKYPNYTTTAALADMPDMMIKGASNGSNIYIKDSAYNDKDTFKAAMSGIYLVYEKATPTTETADPYTNPQIVDPSGTEEYVGSPIPVGHETTYQRICPISGWDSVSVVRVGKNIADTSDYASWGLVQQTDGSWKVSNLNHINGKVFWTPPNDFDGQITVSLTKKSTVTTQGMRLLINYTDNTYEQIGNVADTSSFVTYSRTSNANKIVKNVTGTYGSNNYETYFYAQVELGTTPTTYTPYNGQTYTSTFPKYKQQVSQDKTPYITKNIGDTYADTLTENLVGGTIAWNQSVPDTTTTHTISGSIASMDDAVAGNFESVVCDIEPLQDLHGYDKPWVGGSGKNKFDPTTANAGYLNSSGDVQPQGSTYYEYYSDYIPVSGNIISIGYFAYASADAPWLAVAWYDANKVFLNRNNTSTNPNTIAIPQGAAYAVAMMRTFNHGLENCYFCVGNDLSFAPWENLCPITGWTGCEVDVAGVNLWDEEWEVGSYNSSGEVGTNDRIRSKNYIPCSPNAEYYYYIPSDKGNMQIWFYDINKEYLGFANFGTTHSFTTPAKCAYMRFNTGGSYGTTYGNDISINYPSTDTTYHAYNGQTYNITWQAEAGTVYGGTVDVATGVLTVTWMIESGIVWTKTGTNQVYSDALGGVADLTGATVLCDTYAQGNGYSGLAEGVVCFYNSRIWIRDSERFTNKTTAEIRQLLADMQLVYELTTPQTYQLDPVQVACLLGQNNVWNNISDTTVTYPTNHSYQSLSTTHKYYKRINGVESISVGSDVVANVGTDNIIDLTQMFGTTIADYIYNREQSSSSGMGVKFFKSLFPNDDYGYNSGTLISVNASAHVIKDANGNVLHTYPLDSDLVLRGIPKLDANNKLYYDGDTYASDGTVTRKYGYKLFDGTNTTDGKIRFTDVSQATTADGTKYVAYLPNNYGTEQVIKQDGFAIATGYVWSYGVISSLHVGEFDTRATYTRFVLKDQTITSLSELSNYFANNPMLFIYELYTPTTETADPFEANQAIVSNGIEEYIVTEQGDVEMPVGHDSTYYATEVYGGTIDMAKGVLTITHAMTTYDGTESWTWESSNTRAWIGLNAMDRKENYIGSLICDKLPTAIHQASLSSTGITGYQKTSAYQGQNWLYVKVDGVSTASDFTTWLTNNPITVCYELAIPIKMLLTPQQMQTLSGQNNIWSNTNGGMYLVYQLPITSLLVKRRDVADVSGKWLTLYSTPITQASDMDFTFIDFLNQYGKTYQYALVPVLAQDQSGVVVQIEGGYTVSDNVDSIFDGVYIADQTNVERVKAGAGYGNIDMNQGVGSITPIGSKYPIVITNSQNQYHNGSVRGTIVPNDFYSNGNLSRIDMVNKRDELEQFLTNKRAKIIKDWNGKMWLVMIMSNVACSFDDNYGMGMVSFSADWLEVGDPTNQQDLYNAGLINVGGV